MNQASDHLDPEQQLLAALYVYGGLRNEEARSVTPDMFDFDNQLLDLREANTKLGRARIVQEVDSRLFEKYQQYVEWKNEKNETVEGEFLNHYTDKDARNVIEDCCRLGKIKYSGVHDLRQAYVEREEKKLYQKIINGEVSHLDMVQKVWKSVNADPSLNPIEPVKEYKPKWRNGKIVGYIAKEKKPLELAPRYTIDSLKKEPTEKLTDLFIAQQIGHNDPDTTQEAYRNENAEKNREKFREKMKEHRKNEK